MSSKQSKHIVPSIKVTAFSCPHCGALAKQSWFSCHLDRLKKDELPFHIDDEKVKELDLRHIEDADDRAEARSFAEKAATGIPFVEWQRVTRDGSLYNVSFAQCFNCDRFTIWLYDRLLWPVSGDAPEANPDLPADIRPDYEEASQILTKSPRGAAALLRLCVQKLCKHLGGKGKSIDADIANMVKNGLDVRVQQALDVVRVVGNNAVHPGELDLRDDLETATKLFGLVNMITDIMISQPAHLKKMFGDLPPGALAGIAKRDGKDK